MKMTVQQLQDLGYVETKPGHWHKGNELVVSQHPEDSSVITPKPPKRIRQSTKPLMNKLEQEWFDYLNRVEPNDYLPQSIRFKLANGLWYKPDVVCFHLRTCWEVKGPFAHRGGFENLKMAASKYPWFEWVLVWKVSGHWQTQVVLP